jgi:hypothetical protein
MNRRVERAELQAKGKLNGWEAGPNSPQKNDVPFGEVKKKILPGCSRHQPCAEVVNIPGEQ